MQQERQARKQREEKAEILAKNNEERVKENLRKARIEKLTRRNSATTSHCCCAELKTYTRENRKR